MEDQVIDVSHSDFFEDPNKSPATESMMDLAKKIDALKERHAKLKTEASEVWTEKQHLEAELIEQMHSLDLKSFNHNELGLISISRRIWGKITDVEKAREYLNLGMREFYGEDLPDLEIERLEHNTRLGRIPEGEYSLRGVEIIPYIKSKYKANERKYLAFFYVDEGKYEGSLLF